MTIQPMTAEAIAKSMIKLAGPAIRLDAVRAGYLNAAADLRAIAAKASASKTGKFRNYTADKALAAAALQERMAEEVPAELTKLLG